LNQFKPKGIYIPHITPFKKDDTIDQKNLRELIDFWIDSGVDGLVPCGSNGEAPYLSREERKEVISIVVDQANNRVKIIAGTGSMTTKETIQFSKDADDIGVDGILVITPFFFKPTRGEIINHYRQLNETINTPLLIYNVPKYTGFNLEPSIVTELASIDNIIGMKDSSGNVNQLANIISQTKKFDFAMMAGTGNIIYPSLTLGATGAVVAVGNIVPKKCSDIYNYYIQNELDDARDTQLDILELNRLLTSRYGISAIKYALGIMGLQGGIPRKPMLPIDQRAKGIIKKSLKNLQIIA
jgi:4-hydroxy-tetrahydrodipicolinate synthase